MEVHRPNRRTFSGQPGILNPSQGGAHMTVYMDGVFFLNFLVDFLLLLAASRLCGYPVKLYRIVLGGLLGGVYGACCLLPGFLFLGNILWRTVSLAMIAVAAYGVSVSAMRRGLIFAFLCLALGGAVMGLDKGGIVGIISAAGILCLLCSFGFHGRIGGTTYLPVELFYGDTHISITALQDTGNTLRDPITGRQVLVVGADVASRLTGLTQQQLRTPVESVGELPGLRLIPYRSVGASSFLLAIRLPKVKIGAWQGSTLVAFAPDFLSPEGTYQALTGGIV